jgi:hypothetical protein
MVDDPDFVRVVELDGATYRFEWSFVALKRLERATSQTYFEIVRQILAKRISIDLATELVRAALNGRGAEKWTSDATADLYERAGPRRTDLSDAAIATCLALFEREFAPGARAGKAPGPTGPTPPSGPGSSATPPASA